MANLTTVKIQTAPVIRQSTKKTQDNIKKLELYFKKNKKSR